MKTYHIMGCFHKQVVNVITNVRFIKGRSKMKKLKKQWNKVTVLFDIWDSFRIIWGNAGTGAGWNCIWKYNF